ncbi:YopX family protein [Carnobacterium maltaromaticum]|uniref:YopX family protein n=1 Tax=Carnobacterium maltaromaticum TaxID=2751 RepID=UPI0039AF9D2E
MREIKFRGKRISDGKWIEGVPVPNSLGKRSYILGLIMSDKISYSMNQLHEFCHEVIPESVGQYTGLKDKNDVEIYEGDILKNEEGKIGYVSFLVQEVGYVVVLEKQDYRLGHRNTAESYEIAQGHEIVGNIYDNPELLEVEK